MTRDVIKVHRDATVPEMAQLMGTHGISGLPVVDDRGALIGIVTELDMMVRNANLQVPRYLRVLDVMIPLGNPREFDEEIRRALGTTAADLMTAHVLTVQSTADLADLATLMVDKRVNPVPVVDGGVMVGIVSRSDFIQLMAQDIPTES
jgi:CBS domain-containing protein